MKSQQGKLIDELKAKAFDVSMEDDVAMDMSQPPADGYDYIRRVMIEAEQCEEAPFAAIKSLSSDSPKVESPNYPKELALPKEWQLCQVADFSALRQKVMRISNKVDWKTMPMFSMPSIDDEDGWYEFCFGGGTSHEGDTPLGGNLPLMSMMLKMGPVTRLKLLEYHVEWLQQGKTTFGLHVSRWLYALLTFVGIPLSPETCNTIRILAKECGELKLSLPPEDEQKIRSLNIFICLIVKYFEQFDLSYL